GGRPRARRTAVVVVARATGPVPGVSERTGRAARAAGARCAGHASLAAPGCRSSRARRVFDPGRSGPGASGNVPRRFHHGARHRGRAAARTRGGRARLPREADQLASGAREDQALGGGGPVTSLQFLWVVAVAQGILLVALIILIILNRWFRVRGSARLQPRRQALDAVMQRWTMGQAPAAEVVQALARLPVSLAVDALVTWSARVPGERWQDLSRVLATQWWARVVRTNNRSARWWKRLECARFLSVAATPHDIGRVLRLLRDDHPAVQIAAATTLERLTSPILVTAALDQLPFLGPTVQAYYASALKKARPAVVRHLQQLFGRPDDPATVRRVRDALGDGGWWVRLRAGLALTRFGASGRNVLLAVEVGAHQPSRDMARLVLGLSSQALAEYAA